VVPSMAFCNYEEIIVAKLGKFFCNFVRFYYAINRKKESQNSRRVAHNGDLNSYFMYDMDLKKTFLEYMFSQVQICV